MIPPKDIGSAVAEGTGVPADFALPWNKTRTMADIDADDRKRVLSEAGKRGADIRNRQRRQQFVNDYQKRANLTKGGKIAFAGYDASEAIE